jgi:hypothetical protein
MRLITAHAKCCPPAPRMATGRHAPTQAVTHRSAPPARAAGRTSANPRIACFGSPPSLRATCASPRALIPDRGWNALAHDAVVLDLHTRNACNTLRPLVDLCARVVGSVGCTRGRVGQRGRAARAELVPACYADASLLGGDAVSGPVGGGELLLQFPDPVAIGIAGGDIPAVARCPWWPAPDRGALAMPARRGMPATSRTPALPT